MLLACTNQYMIKEAEISYFAQITAAGMVTLSDRVPGICQIDFSWKFNKKPEDEESSLSTVLIN